MGMELLLEVPSVTEAKPENTSKKDGEAGEPVVELRETDFASFYAEHYPPIARALSITLSDPGWGQEAADEAMTRAFDRWHDVSTYANPSGWVYRVGLNWGRSWHRRLNRRLPWAAEEVALPTPTDVALDAALKDLDIKYRSVVVCRYLLDWSTAQTAEALDLAEGTVKSRLSEGLQRLRSELGEPEHTLSNPDLSPPDLLTQHAEDEGPQS